jgi:GntR family transcriptional regulator
LVEIASKCGPLGQAINGRMSRYSYVEGCIGRAGEMKPDNASRVEAAAGMSGKLYQEMASLLRRAVETGRWRPGDRLPSLEMIAAEFKVSVVTVRQAVALLRQDGLLVSRHGVGTFVPSDLKNKTWIDLQWDMESADIRGHFSDRSARILKEEMSVALPDSPGADDYAFLKRIHFRNKIPYAVANLYIVRTLFDECPNRYREEMVLPLIYEKAPTVIRRGLQTLTIGTADIELARHLDIKLNSPIGEIHRTVYDHDGRVLFQSHSLYRGDIVRLQTEISALSPDT